MSRAADFLLHEFQTAVSAGTIDLASTALTIAKLEYPSLDPAASLAALDELGSRARDRIGRFPHASVRSRIAALNGLLFEDEGFSGNHGNYDDFRNSFLNVVLERRLGIPITLALVYMEVASRAGVDVRGIAFPGHFLMRATSDTAVVIDPFDAGVELSAADCRKLLARYLGVNGDDAPFDASLLRACTPRQMIARMLNNLKRTYLELRSFQRARRVTDLLLALEPTLLSELRARALLAYHLDDYPAALCDLEDYLRMRVWKDDDDQDDRQQLLEHVKTLKLRLASRN